jgi:hypothetical protein
MLKRLLLSFGLFVAMLALVPGAALGAAPPVQPQRIVAVGDLHGDFNAWIDIARAAGLVDSNNRWAGGHTILVQVGDVTDRGPDSLKIIRNLMQLQKAAKRTGGRVVTLVGNHEAMNMIGDLRYTTPGEFAAFANSGSAARRDQTYEAFRTQIETVYRAMDPKMSPAAIMAAWLKVTPLGWVEQRAAWKPDGELGAWARSNPAVAKIGDTVFVHGGISAEYSTFSIDEINRRVAAALTAVDDSDKSILNDQLGPLWYRGLAGRGPEAEAGRPAASVPPRPTVDEEVATVLKAYGAKRLVIGHTPSLSGIIIGANGELARIDTGISRCYNGPLTWLEIVGDKVTPHTTKRTGP